MSICAVSSGCGELVDAVASMVVSSRIFTKTSAFSLTEEAACCPSCWTMPTRFRSIRAQTSDDGQGANH
jgi:hypothetical protein